MGRLVDVLEEIGVASQRLYASYAALAPHDRTILLALIIGVGALLLIGFIVRQFTAAHMRRPFEIVPSRALATPRPPETEAAAKAADHDEPDDVDVDVERRASRPAIAPKPATAIERELVAFQQNASKLRARGKPDSKPAPPPAGPARDPPAVRAQLVITPLRAETSSASEIAIGRQLAQHLEAVLGEVAPYVAVRTGVLRTDNPTKMRIACFELRGSVRDEADRVYFDIELIDAKTEAKLYWVRRAIRDPESLLADITKSVIAATPRAAL